MNIIAEFMKLDPMTQVAIIIIAAAIIALVWAKNDTSKIR